MSDKPTTASETTSNDTRGEPERTTDSGGSSNRRRFLLGVGAATALLAGCVGDDGGGGDDGSNGGDNGGDDGNGDDSSDNGKDDGTSDNGSDDGTSDNGKDDGTSGNGSDDGTSGNGSDDGTSDNGSDDGTSDNGSDDGTSDNGSDDGTSDNGSDDGDPPSDEELAQQFADSMTWDSEEDWRMVWTDETQGITGEYRYHGSDFYIRLDAPEGKIEWYLVENTYYFVDEQSGQCLEFDGGFSAVPSPDESQAVDPEEQYSDPDPDNIPEIEECGTDSIDGDPVTCWEVVASTGETVRYYLLDSGRPRRIEAVDQGFVVDFFDWGSTQPISPPDMQCESPY